MGSISEMTAAQAAAALESGSAILIDVREAHEFEAGHIPQARLVPLSSLALTLGSLSPKGGQCVIFHCQKGGRSRQACMVAAQQGAAFDIVNMAGGIEAWQEAGLPVVTAQAAASDKIAPVACPAGPSPRILRQVQAIMGALVMVSAAAGYWGYPAGSMIAAILGGMLAFSAMTGWCGLAMLVARLPWNRP